MSTLGGNPNFLLIIADDLGNDLVDVAGTGFGRTMQVVTQHTLGPITGQLPTLSLLLRNGVNFTQAWAQPACSPTRASLYTGLHPWKTHVGSPMGNPPLDTTISLATLPEVLPSEYVSGLFGKWHLGEDASTSPIEHGWDKHVGTFKGVVDSYYAWPILDSDSIYDQPIAPYSVEYVTMVTVRAAANWISAQDPATPWFATIAFHTPHKAGGSEPFEEPPAGTTGLTSMPIGVSSASDEVRFNQMTQNMDHNIGTLLGTINTGVVTPIPKDQLENTIVIFIGDNGSDPFVAVEEPKTYIFEGSVRVPMIIADGNAVVGEVNGLPASPRFLHYQRRGSTTGSMAHVIDLYATIVRLIDPAANTISGNSDSADLTAYLTTPVIVWPKGSRPGTPDPGDPGDPPHIATVTVRDYNFSQWYSGTAERATLRNSEFKLNYDFDPASGDYAYSLYRYEDGEIPGREDDGTAIDIYADATAGSDAEALANLNALLDELIGNYQRNETDAFQDPRPI